MNILIPPTILVYAKGLTRQLNYQNMIIIYMHMMILFCPKWDFILFNEVKKIGHQNFYLSGTMMDQGQIKFDCGNTPNDFNEDKFLKQYKDYNFFDYRVQLGHHHWFIKIYGIKLVD